MQNFKVVNTVTGARVSAWFATEDQAYNEAEYLNSYNGLNHWVVFTKSDFRAFSNF